MLGRVSLKPGTPLKTPGHPWNTLKHPRNILKTPRNNPDELEPDSENPIQKLVQKIYKTKKTLLLSLLLLFDCL